MERVDMAFSFISRFRVKSGREEEFIALARKMESLVPLEPATLGYFFFRLEEPGMFGCYESFVDEAGDKAHIESEHGAPLIRQMLDCLAGDYQREILFDLEPAR